MGDISRAIPFAIVLAIILAAAGVAYSGSRKVAGTLEHEIKGNDHVQGACADRRRGTGVTKTVSGGPIAKPTVDMRVFVSINGSSGQFSPCGQ